MAQNGLKPLVAMPAAKMHRVLLGDADIEVAVGMMRPEEVEAGAVGHGGGDGDDLVVRSRRA